MFGIGSNKDGRLGLAKTIIESRKPEQIQFPIQTQIKQISCGWTHSFALSISNTAFSWGYGKTGALANDTFNNCYRPQEVFITKEQILSIKCGAKHSGFLTDTGKVLMCGANNNGQLGLNSKEHVSIATIVKIQSIEQIALGVSHTLLLTRTKEVYTVGSNNLGQLGLGHKANMYTPQKVKKLKDIKQIACSQHSAALSTRGELYLWGTGTFGVYLIPQQIASQSFIGIEVNGSFGVALDSNKNIWTWGTNTNGELGISTFIPKSTPTMIQTLHKKIEHIYCGPTFVFATPEIITKRRSSGRCNSMSTYIKIPGKIAYKDNGQVFSARQRQKLFNQEAQNFRTVNTIRGYINIKDDIQIELKRPMQERKNIEHNYNFYYKDNKGKIGDDNIDYMNVIKEKDTEYDCE